MIDGRRRRAGVYTVLARCKIYPGLERRAVTAQRRTDMQRPRHSMRRASFIDDHRWGDHLYLVYIRNCRKYPIQMPSVSNTINPLAHSAFT